MIYLDNGIRVIKDKVFEHIWVSISNFGLESDYSSISGLSHLLEHIMIRPDQENYVFNGYTTRTGMVFWCKARKHLSIYDAMYELISWFFHPDGRMKVDMISDSLDGYYNELEHEWYYRVNNYNMADPVYPIQGLDLVMCGRRNDFMGNTDYIRKMIRKRFLELRAEQITIMTNEINEDIVYMLNETFGKISESHQKYNYPIMNIPEQTDPSQNIFYVGGKTSFYQVHIKLPDDPVCLDIMILLNSYKSNVELRFLSGQGWCVLHYKTEAEAVGLLKNLYNGLMKPLYVTEELRHTNVADTVSLLYTLSHTIHRDSYTFCVRNNMNIDHLQYMLSASIKIYGNVFIQLPNMLNLGMTKNNNYNAWPGYIDINSRDSQMTIDTWKVSGFSETDSVLGTREEFKCNLCSTTLHGKDDLVSEIKKYNIVFHQTTDQHLACALQYISMFSVRYKIHKGHVLLTERGLTSTENQIMNQNIVTTSLFKILMEYYLRTGTDISKIIKLIPCTDKIEYCDIDSVNDLQEIKNYHPVKKNDCSVIVTPFSFVCGLFDVFPEGHDLDDILWTLKKQGGLYEMYCSLETEGLYLFCHTTQQFTTELKLRNVIRDKFNDVTGKTIISVVSDGLDLSQITSKRK
ncbi:G1L metaloprotease-like protein [Salmon gill poxvirus]|uniref:G1L metaloprotease-like protein n=1 Tax=Salmon gill poxvirus TaxID=1680908 RepID=A0A0H4XWP4_9POXV|nr:G1L metaloprotease-like protein [Salmon gill poxvirus]AKR04273.1 G1L metaloprotease-like protein [Salmon gill poxvirus]